MPPCRCLCAAVGESVAWRSGGSSQLTSGICSIEGFTRCHWKDHEASFQDIMTTARMVVPDLKRIAIYAQPELPQRRT
jgi:uncharacterized protein YodC (DUF2158 family)